MTKIWFYYSYACACQDMETDASPERTVEIAKTTKCFPDGDDALVSKDDAADVYLFGETRADVETLQQALIAAGFSAEIIGDPVCGP